MNAQDTLPRLSVVVNNYNYAHYLPDAIESVLSQFTGQDELVIVDDGSTDDSLAVLAAYTSDPRVVVVKQENRGQLMTVLAGIRRARGNVILLLDSDDYYLTQYLDRVRNLYRERPEVDAVFSAAETFGDDREHLDRTNQLLHHIHYDTGLLGPHAWGTLLFFEFQGTPNSGISLRSNVARKLLSMEKYHLDTPSNFAQFLMNLTGRKADLSHISADGTIVRGLAALGATRYMENTPGFAYRIHGKNYHASLDWFGQQVQRYSRKRLTTPMLEDLVGAKCPTAIELAEELRNRSWPSHRRRHWLIRARYAWRILLAPGSLRQRFAGFIYICGILST